jgi:prepilin-type N-terminal cleavage/methylation domain-containing protein
VCDHGSVDVLRTDDQKGFTLVELAVAMSIMLLVAGALLAALESGTNAEHTASTRIDDEQTVSLTLAQLSHDVRNASALGDQSNPNQVDLIYANGGRIHWWFDAVGHKLWRNLEVPCPTGAGPGAVCWSGESLTGLTNGPGTVFQFLAADGTQLDPSVNPDDVVSCTTTVEVSVTDAAHPPSQPFTQTADAAVLASVDRRGCP